LRFAKDTLNSAIKRLVFLKINFKGAFDDGKGHLIVKIGK